MAKSFSELQTLAIQIRDELNKKKNSAQRVGSALLDIIDNCIQNITDIKQKLSVFEHACSGFKRVSSEAQLPVTPSQEDLAKGFLVNTSLYLYVGTGGNAVNGRYFNVGDIRGPQGEPGSKGETGNTGPTGEKGEQGNSGVTGDTSDIVVINNLDGGESEEGSIKVLAAEQGKVLNKKYTELDFKNNINIFSDIIRLKQTEINVYLPITWNGSKITESSGYKSVIIKVYEGDVVNISTECNIAKFSDIPVLNTNTGFVSYTQSINKTEIEAGVNYLLLSCLNENDLTINIDGCQEQINSYLKNITSVFTDNDLLNAAIKVVKITDTEYSDSANYTFPIFRRNVSGKWTIHIKRDDTYIYVYDSSINPESYRIFEEKSTNQSYNGKIEMIIDWSKLPENFSEANIKLTKNCFKDSYSPVLSRHKANILPVYNINKYIYTADLEYGNNVDLTLKNLERNNCAIFPCKGGDIFYIHASGGFAGRLWCFVNANNQMLTVADGSTKLQDIKIQAPQYSSYLIINFYNVDDTYYIEKEYNIFDAIKPALFGKKIINIADSLGEFKSPISGMTYSQYLEEISGAEVINGAIGGTRLSVRNGGVTVEDPQNGEQAYAALDMPSLATALLSTIVR